MATSTQLSPTTSRGGFNEKRDSKHPDTVDSDDRTMDEEISNDDDGEQYARGEPKDNVEQDVNAEGYHHRIFKGGFWDKHEAATRARKMYFKIMGGATMLIILAMFCVFSIYWGALWKFPEGIHKLESWVVVSLTFTVSESVSRSYISAC